MKLPWQYLPTRAGIWSMCFTGCLVSYMLRSNMAIIIIEMTKLPGVIYPEEQERFDWTPAENSTILGAYFWLFWLSSFFGGTIAEKFGSTLSVMVCHVVSAVMTLATPHFARWNIVLVMISRCVLGFTGGIIYPAAHALIARWAPLHEKGKFVSATVMGTTLGTMVSFSLSGVVIAQYGWPMAFYVQGTITGVWSMFWWYMVADSPDDHKRIGEDELTYIKTNLPNVKKRISIPPYRYILTSFRYACMVQLQFGNFWGLYLFLQCGPQFISSALGFNIRNTGFIGSLPTLARLVLTIIFGVLTDFLLGRKLMSLRVLRKSFVTFSHIIPGLLLYVMITFAQHSTTLAIAMLTMSMGLNGAACVTALSNHQDLAPNFAGTLYGIANSVAAIGGFLAPMSTGQFVTNPTVFQQWMPVFVMGASMYIGTGIFFILFGSTEVQPWNDMEAWNAQKAARK